MNTIKKFFSYYKPYKVVFTIVMIAAVLLASISLLFPMIIRFATKALSEGDVSVIFPTVLVMVVLVLIYTLSACFLSYKGHMMGAHIENDMRKELFAHYQILSLDFFDAHKVGSLMSRLTGDLYNIGELAHHGPEDAIMTSISFIGSWILMATINLKLALVLLALVPALLLYAIITSQRMGKQYGVNREIMSDINGSIEESLSGIRVVKSFANETYENQMFDKLGDTFLEGKRKFYRSEIVFYEGLDGLLLLVPAFVLGIGGLALANNLIDLADFLAFFLLIANFTNPIMKFMHSILLFQDGTSGFKRFQEYMNIEPTQVESDSPLSISKVEGSVTFDDVFFSYDSDTILENINLDINAGSFIALVGASGSGKSTLTSLIPRFYDVSSGSIKIDGIDIQKISFKSLRNAIGVVQQDVYLFSGTLFENIAYGNPSASLEDVTEAAKKANAHEFIMSLPNGYFTDIGHRGVKLSGGQRQRISIARVFLKNPPILIFDEATSSLDNESERIVQEAMVSLSHNRTTIVIAHRLSTIRHAERILVLDQKKIVEDGTHEMLLEKNGAYASLYNAQI